MSDDDIDKQFRKVADSFIDLANQHSETLPPENIGMALLYAASRYNAFVVASHAQELEHYETDRDKAMEFFRGEYQRMLNENLDDYKRAFDPALKYQHLVKNQ